MANTIVESNLYEASVDEKTRLREEKKRMNEIVGTMIFREVFPTRNFRTSKSKNKKIEVHYQIKSVFPNKYKPYAGSSFEE